MISYKKNELIGNKTIRKDRVFQTGSSPRDIQGRLSQRFQPTIDDALIVDLKNHIEKLEAVLLERPKVVEKEVVSGYTEEEFDAELVKVLNVEMAKFHESFKTESAKVNVRDLQIIEQEGIINELNNKLTSLKGETKVLKVKLESAEDRVKDKDSVIDDLRSRPVQVVSEGQVLVDPERPVMDTIVIDPNEVDAVEKLEDNITVEDVSITEKEAITDKVDKLKQLLGGLR